MKSQYYIKQFAELTNVTVRTLHHYDQIGLLKPRKHPENDYRIYTQDDLLRLQQIVTLKFMGFSLRQIGELITRENFEIRRSLKIQIEAIKDKASSLQLAYKALRQVSDLLEKEGRVDWKKIIKIIEVIQMGEETKKEWQEQYFSEEELKTFQEIGQKYTLEQIEDYQNRWKELIDEIKRNLEVDPGSDIAQELLQRSKALMDEAYGDYPQLKKRIGEAYEQDVIPEQYNMLGKDILEFMKKAGKAAMNKKTD